MTFRILFPYSHFLQICLIILFSGEDALFHVPYQDILNFHGEDANIRRKCHMLIFRVKMPNYSQFIIIYIYIYFYFCVYTHRL